MIMILIAMITILISDSKMRRVVRSVAALLVTALVTVGCGSTAQPEETGVHVIATTSIWADVATAIVGDDGGVETLIPIGADAHDFQPSPRQVADLGSADLVIANGLGLEAGFADVLETAAADGANVLEVAPAVGPLPFPGHETDLDPHVWFDPGRVVLAARLIADGLAEVDDSVDWEARADAYAETLAATWHEMEGILATVPAESRKLVTNHESLGYFAGTFGFEVVGVVISGGSTLGEPSSAELAELVATIESLGVTAIFAETSDSTALAEAVAEEVGEEVVVAELYTESLGEPGSGAETLTGMLLTNSRRIADALD
jgi:zinc/manganese transport system substrate-binding protein